MDSPLLKLFHLFFYWPSILHVYELFVCDTIFIIKLTWHPYLVLNETGTLFVHFDLLRLHLGITWRLHFVKWRKIVVKIGWNYKKIDWQLNWNMNDNNSPVKPCYSHRWKRPSCHTSTSPEICASFVFNHQKVVRLGQTKMDQGMDIDKK